MVGVFASFHRDFLSGYFFPSGFDFVQIIALKVIHMTSNGSPEEKLRLMFRMYDKDGNGSIDAREMNEWVAGSVEELEPQKIPIEPCTVV